MVIKSNLTLEADINRVILLPIIYPGPARPGSIINRVRSLTDDNLNSILFDVEKKFDERHKHLRQAFKRHYDIVASDRPENEITGDIRQEVAGSLFSMEYSFQAAALFNPSVVLHPDQNDLEEGEQRFIMSMRATGEGHLSSIVFRSGIIGPGNVLDLAPLTPYNVLGQLNWLNDSESEYDLVFDPDSALEERVIFPFADIECRGLEDLRLVRFKEDGDKVYYGTYTAWNGHEIRPRLLETRDFRTFRSRSLTGSAATDKGMALFPEKIDGKYVMLSRQDKENISIMTSEDISHWEDYQLLMEPEYQFEYAQLGNCGSPLKTDHGWLVLTHGVGPVREYSISAALLDLHEPWKVLGRLDRPLLQAGVSEREGYVPNVVYSCGGMINNGRTFIPYAMSDTRCGFAWIDTESIIDQMK